MGHFLLKEPTDLFSGNVTIQYGESSTPLSFTLVACKGLTCFVIFLFLIDSDAKLIWFPQSPWSTTGGVPFFFFSFSTPTSRKWCSCEWCAPQWRVNSRLVFGMRTVRPQFERSRTRMGTYTYLFIYFFIYLLVLLIYSLVRPGWSGQFSAVSHSFLFFYFGCL